MKNLNLVDKQKMGDQVLNILRKSIMLGDIQAGHHLKETVLSKELGVSRGPIREAIAQLEYEGLVSTPANGRTIVEGFSITDIENLYNTRIQIEKYAISQLTIEAINNGKGKLYCYVELMEEGLSLGKRDMESDLSFHFMLIKLTNNKTLIQLWRSLNGLIQTLVHVTTDFAVHQKNIIGEHLRIVQFLEANELEHAQKELENHLLSAKEFYKRAATKVREDENSGE